MIGVEHLALRVREAESLSPKLKRFRLGAADGGRLPVAPAGSHLLLTLGTADRRWRNAYSLTGPADHCDHYEIIVRRVDASRGGSAFLHGGIGMNAVIETGFPTNLFPIVKTARKHLLFSGGIGITPFLSYLPVLRATGEAVEFHHLCRADEAAVFERLIAPGSGIAHHLHVGAAAHALDVGAVLRRQPVGTHLYLCGPTSLTDAVARQAAALGWPASKLHVESFGVSGFGRPFCVFLERSGIEVEVAADQSLLDAIEAAGLKPPNLCRGGACGECETRVVAGVPEHRDNFLSRAQREANESMMICVSRSEGARLILDL